MDKKTQRILEKLYGEASRKYNIPLEYFTLPEEYLYQDEEWKEIKKKRAGYVDNLSAISADYYSVPKFGHRSFVDDSD
jgi:hypothetical protein